MLINDLKITHMKMFHLSFRSCYSNERLFLLYFPMKKFRLLHESNFQHFSSLILFSNLYHDVSSCYRDKWLFRKHFWKGFEWVDITFTWKPQPLHMKIANLSWNTLQNFSDEDHQSVLVLCERFHTLAGFQRSRME